MGRKLSVGETIAEAFAIYRSQAGLLLPVAFWIFLAAGAFEALAGENVPLLVAASLVSIVLGVLYEGIVISLVRDLRDGKRDSSLGELVREVLPVLPRLAAGLIFIVVAAGAAAVLLVVPGLYLLTIWAVALPVILIERRGLFDSLGRSRQLVRGSGWPTFGVVLVTLLLVVGGSLLLTALGEGLVEGDLIAVVFVALATTVVAPVSGLATTVLYYRLLGIDEERVPAQEADMPKRVEPPAASS